MSSQRVDDNCPWAGASSSRKTSCFQPILRDLFLSCALFFDISSETKKGSMEPIERPGRCPTNSTPNTRFNLSALFRTRNMTCLILRCRSWFPVYTAYRDLHSPPPAIRRPGFTIWVPAAWQARHTDTWLSCLLASDKRSRHLAKKGEAALLLQKVSAACSSSAILGSGEIETRNLGHSLFYPSTAHHISA